jgi:integrase
MNKEIDEFINYCGITATGRTLYKIENKIKQIDKFYEGKLNNLKLKDLHRFLSYLNKKGIANSTKNDFLKVFKRFLKWKYKDWSKRFDDLKDFRINGNDQRKLEKNDLLTPDEMIIIINSIDSLKYKTLLLLFQETACRPEEILKLKWKDINSKKGEIKLHSSKTDKTRYIPVQKSIPHLNRYKKECFYKIPKADDKVFDISAQILQYNLDKIEKKLKFSKHLFPYLWRHSILSNMITKLSPKTYEMYSGHSLETGMKIYAHLDTDNLRDELNEKIFDIEKITKEDNEEIKKLKERISKMEEIFKKIIETNKTATIK